MQQFEIIWDNQHYSTSTQGNNTFTARTLMRNSLNEMIDTVGKILDKYQVIFNRERRGPNARGTTINGTYFAKNRGTDIPVGYIRVRETGFIGGRSAEIIVFFSQLGLSIEYRRRDSQTEPMGAPEGPNGYGVEVKGPFDVAGLFLNNLRNFFKREIQVYQPPPVVVPEPLPQAPTGFRYGRRKSTGSILLPNNSAVIPVEPPAVEPVTNTQEPPIPNNSATSIPNNSVIPPRTWANTFRGYRNAATRAATSAVSGATGAVSGLFGRFFSGAPESTTESTLVSLPSSTSTRRRRSTNYTASQTHGGKRTRRHKGRRRHRRR